MVVIRVVSNSLHRFQISRANFLFLADYVNLPKLQYIFAEKIKIHNNVKPLF